MQYYHQAVTRKGEGGKKIRADFKVAGTMHNVESIHSFLLHLTVLTCNDVFLAEITNSTTVSGF